MSDILNLPRDLGGGLVMRWATAEDAEELAEFNFKHHNDAPMGQPEEWIREWTRDLLDGCHPTTKPTDVTVVVDEKAGGKIVSAVFLISQTWGYEGVAFGCGMPELIATDEKYRRRGLIRQQMEIIHALSEKKGELVQVIGGIPWYYRQFGYEMAIDMGGGIRVPLSSINPLPESKEEQYQMRQAIMTDIPVLKTLYEAQCQYSMINCVRDDAVWEYEIENAQRREVGSRNLEVIETAAGDIIGYICLRTFPAPTGIVEMAVNPDYSLRDVCQFIGRAVKARIEAVKLENKPTIIYFALGENHPAYEALGRDTGQWRRPYAWYVRVPDLPRFLLHIKPVLERRLKESVIAGYSGSLKLDFFTSQLKIVIEEGKITGVASYEQDDFFDFDACFPELTFLLVLFGRRDIDDIRYIFPDSFPGSDESALLLKTLFPKISSHVLNVQ